MKSPSRSNASELRGALLSKKGLTLAEFARRHGYNARSVKAAVRGERSGPVTRKIRAHIERLTRHAVAA